jgi:tRNA(Met) cytidine acetyltransferase
LTVTASAVVATALSLQAHAAASSTRRLLVLEGSADWTSATAREIAAAVAPPGSDCGISWIGDDTTGGIAPAGALQLLGGECGLLIFDAFAGLDPDAVGAAAGTLRSGGLMLLLTPPLPQWSGLADAYAARIAVYPGTAEDVGNRFIARLARLLAAAGDVVRIEEGQAIEAPAQLRVGPAGRRPRPGSAPASEPASPDQQAAVEAIYRVARGRANRPLVLSADRGRGKSAALGIAAARLVAAEGTRVMVTAPRQRAVQSLMAHAAAVSAEAAKSLRFEAPDALARGAPAADLLLVDEAAGIPAPLLERLLERYPRIVFSTTVHGYEGTGRGFEVRFRQVLDRRARGWRLLRLTTPIRWAPDDPLERLLDRALLLDAEPAADAAVGAVCADADPWPPIALLDRDRLAADEPLLRQLFGLLVLAHYQTRPADLRHLLDGPNLSIVAATAQGLVLGTALAAREGGFPRSLLAPVFEGRRRPRGHLLAQTLSAHGGLEDAPALRYARVVRIAVHPAARGRGIGRRLLAALAAHARADGVDLLGASFGATPDLIAFWRRCGLEPAHVGSHRSAASGAHAAVVLQPLTAAGQDLFARARRRLAPRLIVQLAGPLRDLEPAIAGALLAGAPTAEPALTDEELRQVSAFAQAAHGFEGALPALHRLVRLALQAALAHGAIDRIEGEALIACLLQHRAPPQAAGPLGLSGRAQVLGVLRRGVLALRRLGNADADQSRGLIR